MDILGFLLRDDNLLIRAFDDVIKISYCKSVKTSKRWKGKKFKVEL